MVIHINDATLLFVLKDTSILILSNREANCRLPYIRAEITLKHIKQKGRANFKIWQRNRDIWSGEPYSSLVVKLFDL